MKNRSYRAKYLKFYIFHTRTIGSEVSDERFDSIVGIERIMELDITLTVGSNIIFSSPILNILTMEAIHSLEM
jgi:hypothetical protein